MTFLWNNDLKTSSVYNIMEYTFYKISSNNTEIDYCYIGSTKDFIKRKYVHKFDCNNETRKTYPSKIYKTIRDNGGWDNWSMTPIGKGIFESRLDARIEEQKYITTNNASLNSIKAQSSESKKEYDKKWYIDNQEKKKEKSKLYYENNKERLNQRINCECGRSYSCLNKSVHFKSKLHCNYINQTNINL
jgi:hypothetical protein